MEICNYQNVSNTIFIFMQWNKRYSYYYNAVNNDMQLHQLQHQVVTLILHHRPCVACSKQKVQT